MICLAVLLFVNGIIHSKKLLIETEGKKFGVKEFEWQFFQKILPAKSLVAMILAQVTHIGR